MIVKMENHIISINNILIALYARFELLSLICSIIPSLKATNYFLSKLSDPSIQKHKFWIFKGLIADFQTNHF